MRIGNYPKRTRRVAVCTLIFLFFYTSSYGEGVVHIAAPSEIYENIKSLFGSQDPLLKPKFHIKKTHTNLNAIELLTNGSVDLAIVRSDIACEAAQKEQAGFFAVGKLAVYAKLYLIQSDTQRDIYLDEVVGKTFSFGLLGDSSKFALENVFDAYGVKYRFNVKAMDLNSSLKKITDGSLDGYLGFLPKAELTSSYSVQTVFSEKTLQLIKKSRKGITTDEYEAKVSYLLTATDNTSDKKIEDTMYVIMKRKKYLPIEEYIRDLPLDPLLFHHLRAVKEEIARGSLKRVRSDERKTMETGNFAKKTCKRYHYEFLKLLRLKPLSRKMVHKYKYQNKKLYGIAKKHLKAMEAILLDLDEKRFKCDLDYISRKKREYLKRYESIKAPKR